MIKKAYLAGGCFWGLEALFKALPGVVDTEVGYTGGVNANPTYQNHAGHAEALQIAYNNAQISYMQILDYFFRIHDPTTIDRQGNDTGSSYRSAIFYQNNPELKDAQEIIKLVGSSGNWDSPVVTKLEPFTKFWPAEANHQDYLQLNPGGYTCHFVRSFGSYLNSGAGAIKGAIKPAITTTKTP